MEKVVKNHTCSHHIQRDGISKIKEGHGFGFLGKGNNCIKVFVSQLSDIGGPILKISMIFLNGVISSISRLVKKKYFNITHVLHLCEVALS